MFRRSILEISSRRSVWRIPRRAISQTPVFLATQKQFSSSSSSDGGPRPPLRGSLSKVVIGSIAIGTAFLAAYQTGYLDQYFGKIQDGSPPSEQAGVGDQDLENVLHSGETSVSTLNKETTNVNPLFDHAEKTVDVHLSPDENAIKKQSSSINEEPTHSFPSAEHVDRGLETKTTDSTDNKVDNQLSVQNKFDVTENDATTFKEDQLHETLESIAGLSNHSKESTMTSEAGSELGSTGAETSKRVEEVQTPSVAAQDSVALEENEAKTLVVQDLPAEQGNKTKVEHLDSSTPLLEEYYLGDDAEKGTPSSLYNQVRSENNNFTNEKEGLINTIGDGYISKDGKLVLDFLQAIHAAEKRQADLDAHVFAEEKRTFKEKYEKELKDAAARELMLAEEAAMLDKELKRERSKAAAAIKSLQERMEEKLRMELKNKESEAEAKLQKFQDLTKAELNAAIANEKATQIKKMAEANLNINALCMAFYARSEEARQSHAAHKLALGALALEDALSKGYPIQTEIKALRSSLEGIDKDSVLDLVFASLPDETQNKGTETILQLNHKFDAIKGMVRHFSLIPPNGGGILTHAFARIASLLKVKNVDQSGDGIESVISKVERFLAEGKLAEAADTLEEGVRGTQAEQIIRDWVTQARNRAITEQALILLQSYATAISLT